MALLCRWLIPWHSYVPGDRCTSGYHCQQLGRHSYWGMDLCRLVTAWLSFVSWTHENLSEWWICTHATKGKPTGRPTMEWAIGYCRPWHTATLLFLGIWRYRLAYRQSVWHTLGCKKRSRHHWHHLASSTYYYWQGSRRQACQTLAGNTIRCWPYVPQRQGDRKNLLPISSSSIRHTRGNVTRGWQCHHRTLYQ